MSSEIRDAIKEMSKPDNKEVYGVPCTVTKVEGLKCTCAPINGNSDFLKVRLQAGDGNGIIMIPKVGSVVMVQPINDETGFVSLFSSIDSIQFLDGTHGGLIKIDDLVTKLNNVESDINDLKTAFSSWVTVASDGGAALKAITATWFGLPLTETKKSDLENELITHGDK